MIEKRRFRFLAQSALFIVALVLVSCSPFYPSPLSPSYEPEVIFRIYKPIEKIEEVLDAGYLQKTEQLPKLIELDAYSLKIMSFDIQKKATDGFVVSMEVEFQGETGSLGFWHGRDPTAEYFSDENGCILDVPLFCEQECEGIDVCGGYDCRNLNLYTSGAISSNSCAGILMIEVDRWKESPSKEEREEGIEEVLFTKWIFLNELDYDYLSDEWNYAKVVLSLHREEMYPPMPE